MEITNTNEAANNLFKQEQDKNHEASLSKLTEIVRAAQKAMRDEELETLRARIAELEENAPSRFERLWNAAEDHNNTLLNKVAELEKQRDALLDFANHIATAPQLSGTGWQEMAQMVVASAKGGE